MIKVENLVKNFGPKLAVNDVSFSVERGEVLGFLGPNGAGKSTTMRMITQYLEPDHGTIRLDGVPLDEAGRDAKRRIGYLPENNPLYGDMLVGEYLTFAARLRDLHGSERRSAMDETVVRTGIGEVFYRPIAELSKGFRQRVGLAQAILHRPDLLVLDEPTEGLDPNQRLEIRRLIAELGEARTVILSTHVLPEVQDTCSRLLVIHRGRIAADGPVESLTAQAEGRVVITVEAAGDEVAEAIGALEGVRGISDTQRRDERTLVTFFADGSRELRPAVFQLAKAQGWTLYELHQETRRLEDLFRQLTSGE